MSPTTPRRRGDRLTWNTPARPSPTPAPVVDQDGTPLRSVVVPQPDPPSTDRRLPSTPSARRHGSAGPALPPDPPSTVRRPTSQGPRKGSAGPVCGHRWGDQQCQQRGEHLCETRVAHVVGFFAECLVHTKGRWTHQAFILAGWQVADIVAPLFGTVVWSTEADRYVRRYRIAWIELARKQGKALDVSTSILAGRGWTTMGDLVAGDQVHAEDGTLADVQWVSERHHRPSYTVRFADGAEIVAADDHKWTVNDLHLGWSRVVTTVALAEEPERYSVTTPGPVVRGDVDVPVRVDVGPANAIVAVKPAGDREVVCISVDHPSHVFLAGRSLTPTHNSEMLAGIALYLLVADGEGGAEIYGCARDRDQARKVFDVAERMVKLSKVLSRRLKIYAAAKRIVDERTGSWYEIVAADAAGNLGHNPAGVILDETITQRDGKLWEAMRTAMGARDQPLMVAATTAGDDDSSFAAAEHAEMQRVLDQPDRAPHIFVVMRNTPADADPWDEANWVYASPALGTFFSLQTLRDEAIEAKNDPTKENSFRQFRLNQWVSQSSRWMPLHKYDASCGELWLNPGWGREKLAGRECFAGFDLAAKFDLTAWCILFPGEEDEPVEALWRFWLPEAGLARLDKVNDGKFTRWAKAGWLTVTEGNVIDYDRVCSDIAEDAAQFAIRSAHCDEWSMWPIINRIAETCGLDADNGEVAAYRNTFEKMSAGMDEVYGLVMAGRFEHHGNPIARFCMDACEVRRAPYDANLIRPSKPERGTARARIDAVPTAAMAANAMRGHAAGPMQVSAYERDGLMVV